MAEFTLTTDFPGGRFTVWKHRYLFPVRADDIPVVRNLTVYIVRKIGFCFAATD